MSASYPYASGDLIARPQRYFYAPLGGRDFLRAWRETRERALRDLAATRTHIPTPVPPVTAPFDTMRALHDPDDATIDRLINRFEITRRIHPGYDARIVRGEGDHTGPAPYARLARHVGERLARHGRLGDLNVLLKLDDVLIAALPLHAPGIVADMRAAIARECDAVEALMRERGLCDDG